MDNANFFEDIHNIGSQLHKDFTFQEHIVITMTTVLNNKVVVPLQNENTVIHLQGTDTVHPEVDSADEVEPEFSTTSA